MSSLLDEYIYERMSAIAIRAHDKKTQDESYELTDEEKMAVLLMGGARYRVEHDEVTHAVKFVVDNANLAWIDGRFQVYQAGFG